MAKRNLVIFITFLGMFVATARGQDTKYPPQGEQIPRPESAAENTDQCCFTADQVRAQSVDSKAWLADIRHWRAKN